MALWETNRQTNVLMENLPILQDTAAQRACLKPVSAPKLAHMEIAIKSELKCIEIYFSNLDIKLLNRAFWAVELWYHIGEIFVSIFPFLPPCWTSNTPWLFSQAIQLASQTSGWPLRPSGQPLDPPHGLSDPQADPLAGFQTISSLSWLLRPSIRLLRPSSWPLRPSGRPLNLPAGLSDPLAGLQLPQTRSLTSQIQNS